MGRSPRLCLWTVLVGLLFLTPHPVAPFSLSISHRNPTRDRALLSFDATHDNVSTEETRMLQERVWRHVPKPFLRIGSRGLAPSHGNSLRQLLADHTVVKVKLNVAANNWDSIVAELQGLAVEQGAPADMELIQQRRGDRIVMFGMPGTLERVMNGTFPPSVL